IAGSNPVVATNRFRTIRFTSHALEAFKVCPARASTRNTCAIWNLYAHTDCSDVPRPDSSAKARTPRRERPMAVCMFCGRGANVLQIQNSTSFLIECQRCGRFIASFQLRFQLGNGGLSDDERVLLPYVGAYIRRRNSESREPPEIQTSNWMSFADAHAHTSVA